MAGVRNFTYCTKDTGGTCGLMSCFDWHGHTDCINGKCLCRAGHCAINGYCLLQDRCKYAMVQGCTFYDCPKSLGATVCKDRRCQCAPESCETPDGSCVEECLQDTGGSCSWFDCDPTRGLTFCNEESKCICQKGKGLCSINGACGRSSNPIPPPTAAISEAIVGPEHASSPPAIAAFGGAVALFLVAGLACRRRRRTATAEPLLS
eukprot:NODE_16328_length_1000_cov_4.337915.p1 GENE.NODE_16328_length_1000_cov_4.337915~~NODE_16328_length_1000_cov_4.337915.p1  ORF type:complete len:206 (+),score=37.10 NODE_16328_length_1000_cov_4.337915:213-830(+)